MKYAVRTTLVLSALSVSPLSHADILQTLYVGGGYNSTQFAGYKFYQNARKTLPFRAGMQSADAVGVLV